MNDTLREIQDIPMSSVLDKVWLCYHNDGSIENTDWWKVNFKWNYVNDFSRDRWNGWPFNFIKHYLNLENKEVYKWFSDNYNISNKRHRSSRRTYSVFTSYSPLPCLNEKK